MEITILTTGSKVKSPNPERRKFYISVRGVTPKQLEKLATELESAACDIRGYLVSEEDFKRCLHAWCWKCNNALRYEFCFKHQTIHEAEGLIGYESNHEYGYYFSVSDNEIEFEFELGAGLWVIRGVINTDAYTGEVAITRPGGKTFVYKIENKEDYSAKFLLNSIAKFLSKIVRYSYYTIVFE